MIRCAEAVLDGHPDKFCDIIADRIVGEAQAFEIDACVQVELGVWSDQIWLSGGITTNNRFELDIRELIIETGLEIGLNINNHIDVTQYKIADHICRNQNDPVEFANYYTDQCIAIGWAGFNHKTRYLPPEQYLVHRIREVLSKVVKSDSGHQLSGEGPDGKILVRLRENWGGEEFNLEHILITLQHQSDTPLHTLKEHIRELLYETCQIIKSNDDRWITDMEDITITINPNGEFVAGGSDSDNGQTGRKLVMDYYGPRVPIGGGALSGKSIAYIDRSAAYAARELAIKAVQQGESECQVQLNYAPGIDEPLDVYISSGNRNLLENFDFFKSAINERYHILSLGKLGSGTHFYDDTLLWNQ